MCETETAPEQQIVHVNVLILNMFVYFQVNEKFAIDLVDEEPPKEIHARHVWCDGGQDFYILSAQRACLKNEMAKQ